MAYLRESGGIELRDDVAALLGNPYGGGGQIPGRPPYIRATATQARSVQEEEDNPEFSCLNCGAGALALISGIALFVICCMAIAGKFPSPHLGYIVIGLGGGSIALMIAGASSHLKGKVAPIIGGIFGLAVICTLGGLGAAGILTNYQLGSIYVWSSVAMIGLGLLGSCVMASCILCC